MIIVKDMVYCHLQIVLKNYLLELILNITLTGSDPNQIPLVFIIVEEPLNGEISGESPNLIYTPNNNFFGQDNFSYQAYNGNYYSNSANVLINIESVNDSPLADSISLNVDEDAYVNFTLSGNDTEGDDLTYNIEEPSNGTLSGDAPNLIYTPDSDFFGVDSF